MGLDWSRDPKEFIRGAHYQAIVHRQKKNCCLIKAPCVTTDQSDRELPDICPLGYVNM